MLVLTTNIASHVSEIVICCY